MVPRKLRVHEKRSWDYLLKFWLRDQAMEDTSPRSVPMLEIFLLYSFQVKSGKELKAFLFNDFLMLTRPRSSITGSLSKKIGFESNEQDVIYDIYRKVR